MKTVRGTQPEMPLELDFESSPTTIYLRSDIHQVEDISGSGSVLVWEYQEDQYEKTDENIALVTKLYADMKKKEIESLSAYYSSVQANVVE